ncbi:MAG: class I SAM-dependent methyltransferase [Sphingobium sp.]
MPAARAIAALSPPQKARMDSIYRTQRHFYDLTRKYYLLGRDRLIEALDAGEGMSILEVGCGTGRNLVAAARRWQDADFCGLDISSAMLEKAQTAIRRSGLDQRIRLTEADACDFSGHEILTARRFDRIFFSYTLSMIPAWEYAIEEALGALAPQGTLHIVDFGQQEHLPRWFRALLFGWLHRFHVRPRADLRAVLEEAASRHGRALHFEALYRGYAWSATIS